MGNKILSGSIIIVIFTFSGGYSQRLDSVSVGQDSVSADSAVSLSDYDYLRELGSSILIDIDFDNLPEQAFSVVENLNFSKADLVDVFRALGREYHLNLIIDNQIEGNLTQWLTGIPVIEVIIQLCLKYNLKLEQLGNVFRIERYEELIPQKKEEREPEITVDKDKKVSFNLQKDDLPEVVRVLAEKTGKNIMIRNGVNGKLSGMLRDIPFEKGFKNILENNGFSLRKKDGIYLVDHLLRTGINTGKNNNSNFWISVDENNRISMDLVNAQIQDVLREIVYQTGSNLITYETPVGTITANSSNLTLEETLNYIFKGTNYTFRKENDIYLVGGKQISGIATTKLIQLDHVRADEIIKLIPENIKNSATLKVVKEQNGIMVIGTNDLLFELENFINEIDHPTPQILIEAVVIDFNTTDLFELGVTLAKGAPPDSSFLTPFGIFGRRDARGRQSGGIVAQGDGNTLKHYLNLFSGLFGFKKIGSLPEDFFFRIQALDREGVVNVRSRPQISTLNGHTASIEIGTTQYFILKSTSTVSSTTEVIPQENERFVKIEANVSLKITPWVSASGEVTAEIKPEFNTPVGEFSPNVPPTINSRVLNSTVRLKDGETIILGGLIQENKVEQINKVPIIGSIPLLGRLFRNRYFDTEKQELVVFITPYVFYGDGYDRERWKEVSKKLEVHEYKEDI